MQLIQAGHKANRKTNVNHNLNATILFTAFTLKRHTVNRYHYIQICKKFTAIDSFITKSHNSFMLDLENVLKVTETISLTDFRF